MTDTATSEPPPRTRPRGRDIHWHHGRIGRAEREAAQGHRGGTLWLTGLSGSGKSTIAHALEEALFRRGHQAYVLDGDNVRHGLNRDLGFTPQDREENIRRIGEVARLLTDFGALVVTAFISPYRRDREVARALHPDGDFHEVHVDCSLEVCELRDPKGLYRKARAGEIAGFTGISAPYEPPEEPELRLDTEAASPEDSVAALLRYLEERGVIPALGGAGTITVAAGRAAAPRSGATGIPPYGGDLVDRVVLPSEARSLRAHASSLPSVAVSQRTLTDLHLIGVGAYSPLEGFLGREDYGGVLERMRLANGLPWTIPITLPVDRSLADGLIEGSEVALTAPDGEVAAILDLEERFDWDREREAEAVYGTTDRAHPGVAKLEEMGEILLAGPIRYLGAGDLSGAPELNLGPAETRAEIARRGWRTVVGFQTRNPVHRAHEYLQKCALEVADGLLLHPLVGETKDDDIEAGVRIACYRTLLERYYPEDRVLLSVLPASMRYAGPREAVFHAILRRNYGCTHFIVGRDHAGVGDYYGTYDAQQIFDAFAPGELGIEPLRFEHAFHCRVCGQMATAKTCPHGRDEHLFLSGTRVRELLARGEAPPPEFTRVEVAEILLAAERAGSGEDGELAGVVSGARSGGPS